MSEFYLQVIDGYPFTRNRGNVYANMSRQNDECIAKGKVPSRPISCGIIFCSAFLLKRSGCEATSSHTSGSCFTVSAFRYMSLCIIIRKQSTPVTENGSSYGVRSNWMVELRYSCTRSSLRLLYGFSYSKSRRPRQKFVVRLRACLNISTSSSRLFSKAI